MAGEQRVQFDLFSSYQEKAPAVAAAPFSTLEPVVGGLSGVVAPALNGSTEAPVAIEAVSEALTGEIPSVPEVSARSSAAAGAISDAGAELTYNRRNRVKTAIRWDDVSELNDALKVKEVVKSKIWPKIDYEKLIDGGMEPLVAHIVKQVYDSVAAKPNSILLNDSTFERYISALNKVENGLMEWVNNKDGMDYWLANSGKNLYGRQFGTTTPAIKSLLDYVFPDGWRENRDVLRLSGGNKLLSALQPGYEEARKALKAIKEGWPSKRESWEIQGFRVLENPAVEVVGSRGSKGKADDSVFMTIDSRYVRSFDSLAEAEAAKSAIGPFVLFGKRGFLNHFKDEASAIEAAKEQSKRAKGSTVSDKGTKVQAVEREGIARRMPGEDISSERLMEEFGLKGVNFGNWMKTPAARAEAQLHLNHAFDSFHDLADVLGVPPKAISLNGMLGLAIGAQGSGGTFAAHFVAGVNEINLTRTCGAGSLAHEWAHAMDHYFAVQAGFATAERPFLTEHASNSLTKPTVQMVQGAAIPVDVPRFGSLRPEIALAFSGIVESINKREPTAEELETKKQERDAKTEKNINGWLRSIRRDFVGQEDAFDALSEKVRQGNAGEGRIWVSRSLSLSPVLADMRSLYKEKHGHIYPLDQIKSLQAWVNHAEFSRTGDGPEDEAPAKAKLVETDYAKAAAELDKGKGGKPYWSTNLEKFARAFDAFITDSLDEKLVKNQYLSHTGRTGHTVPSGADRIAINGAFRALLDAVEVKEQGATLFSQGPSDKASTAKITLPEINAEIKRIKGQWPSMPRVSVVMDVKDLPFESPANTDGAICDRHVYVVANNIVDLKQLQKVMAHECVLHHSLTEMLGDYGFSKLHHGLQKLKKDGDPTICSLAENIHSRYGKLPPEIETKEIVARAGELCLDDKGEVKVAFGFMKGVFAGVAGWLRDHGISIPFTNTELQGIMHNAGEWIKQDRNAPIRWPSQEVESGVVLNSFGGIRAETAPLETLIVAREMFVNGEDDRDIWKATGWTFGFADGKPRFEISDNQANVVVENRTVYDIWKDMEKVDKQVNTVGQFISKYPEHPLAAEVNHHQGVRAKYSEMRSDDPSAAREIENYLDHKRLFDAYPELAKIKAGQPAGISALVNSGAAAFIPDANLIKYSKINNPDQFISTTLHELQHAIQDIEGFSPGGSPSDFKDLDLSALRQAEVSNALQKLYDKNPDFYRDVVRSNQLQNSVIEKYGPLNSMRYDENDPLVQEWWDAVEKRDGFPESREWGLLSRDSRSIAKTAVVISPHEQYERLAGESEARLTQARIDMTPEERAQEYPLDDFLIPVQSQVVKAATNVPPLVSDGFYTGKVLDIDAGVVTQRINRAGDVVRHSLAQLSVKVSIGDAVHIAYRGGVGVVGGLGVEPKGR